MKYIHKYLTENTNLFIVGGLPRHSFGFLHRLVAYVIRRVSELFGTSSLITLPYKWKIREILKRHKIDAVFIQTLPFYNYFLCEYTKKIVPEIEIVVDMSDPLVPNLKFDSMSRRMKDSLISIEKDCFKYIDCLCVLNGQLQDYYQHLKFPPQKTIVIEQGTDLVMQNFQSNKENNFHMSLIYAGGFYLGKREPFPLYESVLDSKIDLKLSVYSHFGLHHEFVPPISNKIEWFDVIAQDELYEKYGLHDVIVFLDNTEKYQVPGKLFEVLIMRKPVLFIYSNEESPSLQYVRNIEGIFFAHNNKPEIMSAIQEIWASKKYYYRDPNKYLWVTLLKRLDFIFKEH